MENAHEITEEEFQAACQRLAERFEELADLWEYHTRKHNAEIDEKS